MKLFYTTVLSLFITGGLQAAEHAHTHGVASLNIAVEGNKIVFDLESPLDSLLGFEHLPANAQQRQAANALRAQLNKPAELFSINPEAGCKQSEVTLESPVLQADAKPAKDEHMDLDGSFSFVCNNPTALREVDVRMFTAFPRLKSLKVGIVSSKGQRSLKLNASNHRIAFQGS